jgi:hypothetical protein
MLYPGNTVRWPPEQRPMLLSVIDTEEEFDWNAPPSRSATAVSAMQFIDRIQTIFDEYRLRPCYVVDYPVAATEDGIAPLREIHRAGHCEIGAHLHPWVNPPYQEELTPRNSYPGNLTRELESAKLDELTAVIREAIGQRPIVYKAGRYGVGPNTTAILERFGFEVDVSICPPVDYRADGGPDFRAFSTEPYWFGTNNRLLEIPLSGAFIGWASRLAPQIHDLASQPLLRRLKVPGILARARAIDRLVLSPEGFSPEENRRLTIALLARGVRTFTWSLHSPSVEVGHTPYVRTRAELSRFLDSFRQFFDFFFGELSGIAITPTELKRQLEARA